jgi:hypothetical protein
MDDKVRQQEIHELHQRQLDHLKQISDSQRIVQESHTKQMNAILDDQMTQRQLFHQHKRQLDDLQMKNDLQSIVREYHMKQMKLY